MEHSEIRCQSCGDVINRPPGSPGPKPKYCSKIACNAQHRNLKRDDVLSIFQNGFHTWSKNGGEDTRITKEIEYDWYCQVCKEQFPKEMTPMLFPLDIFGKEFARICGECHIKAVRNKINEIHKLMNYIRANWPNL